MNEPDPRPEPAALAAALSAAPDDEAELAHLSERLAVTAHDEGLLDVAHRTVDSPYGSLLVATTPVGVVRIAFEREGHDAALAQLAAAISPRILQSAQRTDEVARQLDDYFAGRRRSFEVAVDLRLVQGFRRRVVEQLADIPYGVTESYAQVAARSGSPGAVRAVGSACSHNPVPILLPCHRVVRSDGSIGQYLGGTDVKAALLELEAAAAS